MSHNLGFRHLLYVLLTAIVATACTSQYNIDGNSSISGLDGQKMYLRLVTLDGRHETVCLDSCEVVHGSFKFDGVVDSVAMAELYMGSAPMMPIVLENGSMFIQMDNAMQSVTGGPLNDRLGAFLIKRGRLENELWDLNRRARNMVYEGKTVEQIVAAIDPLRNTLVEQLQTLEIDFVRANFDNVLGPGYFMRMCNTTIGVPAMTEQLISIIADAPRTFIDHPGVRQSLFMAGITEEMISNHRLRADSATTGKSTTTGKKKR